MANSMSDRNSRANGLEQDLKERIKMGERSISKTFRDASDKAEKHFNSVVETADDYAKSGRKYVRAKPAKGITFAVLAGFLMGFVTSLFMRRQP